MIYTTYHDAVPPGSPAGAFKVISHVEQLALSACARNSGGRLWCGTCHDPHNIATPSRCSRVAFFRSRCLACHTQPFPASHPSKDSDCLGCHMPRRAAKDGGHTPLPTIGFSAALKASPICPPTPVSPRGASLHPICSIEI